MIINKKLYGCYLCEKQYEYKLNTIKLNNKEEHICDRCINQLKNLIGKQKDYNALFLNKKRELKNEIIDETINEIDFRELRYMREKIFNLVEDVNLLNEERIARNKEKLSLNKNTSFYPIQNDNFIGTKIYFVPTDADIVRETIIRGCVKNDKGEKFLIIDKDKNFDFESIKIKDDMHIFTNKADAEKHLQDLLKGGKE